MKTIKLKEHNDGQHGWFALKRIILTELNIADKITRFSFEHGQTVYLEEDKDAETLMIALKAQADKYEVEIVRSKRKGNGTSIIRTYAAYQLRKELKP